MTVLSKVGFRQMVMLGRGGEIKENVDSGEYRPI